MNDEQRKLWLQFAGQAMQGMLSDHTFDVDAMNTADLAFDMADAMMAELADRDRSQTTNEGPTA